MPRRTRNEGTIYKKTVIRKGKKYTYWEAQVTIGHDPGTGGRIRKTFTGESQKEVRMKMQEASLSLQKQEYFEPSKATLGEWIDLWLSDFCPRIKYQTKKSYAAQCNTHIKPTLGATLLSDLNTAQIQSFYNELGKTGHTIIKKDPKTGQTVKTSKPLSPKSINNVHAILSKCLNVAVKLNYIKFNPASQTERIKSPRPHVSPLSNDEVRMVLSELEKEPLADLYKVIIFTGLRKAEALGLTWDSIDFDTSTISIDKQLQHRPIKDGGYTIAPVKSDRIRSIVATPYVISILQHRKSDQDQDKEQNKSLWSYLKDDKGKDIQLVFTKPDGSPINPKQAYLHYNKLARRLGIDATRVHDLRHTFAVLSLQNGDDYKTIQENLGHASASFTLDVYGHRTTKMQQDSADKMQKFIDSITAEKTEK